MRSKVLKSEKYYYVRSKVIAIVDSIIITVRNFNSAIKFNYYYI